MPGAGRKRKRDSDANASPNVGFASVLGAIVGNALGGAPGAVLGAAMGATWGATSGTRRSHHASASPSTKRARSEPEMLRCTACDQSFMPFGSSREDQDRIRNWGMCPACFKNNTRQRGGDGGHHAGARGGGRASSGRGAPARDKHGHAAKRQYVRDIDRPAHGRSVHVCIMSPDGWVMMLNHTKSGKWQWPGGESSKHEQKNLNTKIFEVAFREAGEELGTNSDWQTEVVCKLLRLKEDANTKMCVVSSDMSFVNMAVLMPSHTCQTLQAFMEFFNLPGRHHGMRDRMYNTPLSDEHKGYCFVRLEDIHEGNPLVKVHGARDNGRDKYIKMQCKHMYSADTLDALQRMYEKEISWASLPG